MLNFLFLVRLQTDDVVFLVEQESILYVFSVPGEYVETIWAVWGWCSSNTGFVGFQIPQTNGFN